MEILVWHEGLGSDDDAATEEESAARILFFWPPKPCSDQLNVLQLLQGAFAFAQSFREAPDDAAAHVHLTTMHYVYRLCEPHVWLAFGLATDQYIADSPDDASMEAALRLMYDTFRLFHGSVESRALQVQNDVDARAFAAATGDVDSLRASIAQLEIVSPLHRFRSKCEGFFPSYARALGILDGITCLVDMIGLPYYPANKSLQLNLQLLLHTLSSEVPEVVSSAAFVSGQLVWTRFDVDNLSLIHTLLRLREQEGYKGSQDTASALWIEAQHKYDANFNPIWSSQQGYAERQGSPSPLLKRRPSARDYFAEVSSSFKTPSSVPPASGFQCTDGTYASAEKKDVWVPTLFQEPALLHQKLLVWHESTVTLVLVVESSTTDLQRMILQETGITGTLEICQQLQSYLDGHPQIKDASRLATSSPSAASVPLPPCPFLHYNRMTRAVQWNNAANLGGATKDDAMPWPLRLQTRSIPRKLLSVLNEAHAEMTQSEHLLDLCVKTPTDGWVVARRSGTLGRELYAFFDSGVDTIGNLSAAVTELILEHFQDTFM
ncbi:hypothetical protein ACHHYP_05683 [Achlya hypogyna]|uniref:Uncharacterized protein n=1 Tax=Achlya hypogyna TaxID=1202772 RepID=A0A1V9YXA0_ACHHY|nr:hypothetical protein ACHHYP_05683 [Achlya hypogyna]